MAKRVLSIEISRTLTKVCEVDYQSKNSKVYKCFTVQTPSGVFEDGFLTQPGEFGAFISNALAEHDIRTKQVVFTISSSRIANREVVIPLVKEKMIPSIVKTNAGDYFPVDISGYHLAHKVLGLTDKDGQKMYKLLVLAAPRPLLETYYEVAKAAGLSIVALDYSGNSIVPVVQRACGNEVTMIIKVDETATLLTILKDQSQVFQRVINAGADHAIETVRELHAFGDKLTFFDASTILRGKTCIRKNFDADVADEGDNENGDEEYRKARIELTDSLRGLVASIIRVIDYYNSRNSEFPIEKFLLTGFGGDFSGLSKLLSNEIGSKVSVISHVDGIFLDKGIGSEQVSFGEYIACIGAAIAPVDLALEEQDPKKKKKEKKQGGNILTMDISDLNTGQVCIVLFVLCMIASIGLSVFAFYNYGIVKTENDRLSQRVEELKPVLTIYNDNQKAQTLYDDVVAMYDMTLNNNENIVAFIEELQSKLPAGAIIDSMETGKAVVVIDMSTSTQAEIGKTIEALRTFDSVKDVAFESARLDVSDMGTAEWKFTVTAYYRTPDSVGVLNQQGMTIIEEEGAE